MRQHRHVFFALAVIFDIVAGTAAWVLCYVLRFQLGPFLFPDLFSFKGVPGFEEFAILLPVVVPCDLIMLGMVGLYQPARTRSLFREWMQVVQAAVLAWLVMIAVYYYSSSVPYSRKLLFLFLFVNPVSLMASRLILRKILRALRKRGWGTRHAAIIGAGKLGQETLHRLRRNVMLGVKVDYFIAAEDDRSDEIHGVPVRGSVSNLLQCMRDHPVDSAYVAVPARHADKMDGILRALAKLPVAVAVIPDFSGAATLNASVSELEGLPVIRLRDTPITGWHAVAKRAIDLCGAIVLLVVFGVPMLILALLVKLTSRGPVIFKQERMGLGGRPFMLLKFRSMRIDAETDSGPVWAKESDSRCTGIGAFMRRTSLDELPQLINILKGDMSLVGPRPERPHFVRQFTEDVPAYMLRHNVKAGLTGWAQVNGLRGNTSLRKRLQYDLYYINNWSFWFDVFILLMTPFSGLVHKNAY